MSQYPEHDKLHVIVDKSQTIGQFVDWLHEEQNIHFARWETRSTCRHCDGFGTVGPDDEECWKCDGTGYTPGSEGDYNRLIPVTTNIQVLLASYFGIDLNKLEAEKEAMLETQRALNARYDKEDQ